jgi:hypothetical protein
MATLLTAAQSAELLALQELYRGVPANPQGLIPEDVVKRVADVMVPALDALGFTYEKQTVITNISQRPWLFWASLVALLDDNATGYIFQIQGNWEFWLNVLIPSLTSQPPEKPMGLSDGLAVEVAKALKELPGLEEDFSRGGGATILEAIKQAPLVLMLETIRNINSNYTF